MSGDEILVLVFAGVMSFIFWGHWIRDIMFIYDRRGTYAGLGATFVPFLAMAGLFLILKCFASSDVRDSLMYLIFYMVMGCAWCGLMTQGYSFLGLDFRHDIAEQDNYAADIALSGAVIGGMLCFAGGNIGDGPGWWVVIFCAIMATGGLLLVWFALDLVNGVCENITVDRDLATGIRFAGIMVASGLVLGRAVAGNWVSEEAAWSDFIRTATPLLMLVVLAAFIDRLAKPTRDVPRQDPWIAGIFPALLYCFISVAYVISRGAW